MAEGSAMTKELILKVQKVCARFRYNMTFAHSSG